jgi:UDP-N-acetylglucosamine--N-acetylmuramyl-(pentapeptide) pyrophosphoryl-undecaprenol N-acetylglucosamine transferase
MEGLADLVSAADVVISRAGAASLWENANLGSAMILVPLVAGSRGDQIRNAARFSSAGGAIVLQNGDILELDLKTALDDLLNDPERARLMGERARGLVWPDATDRLAAIVRRYALQERTER